MKRIIVLLSALAVLYSCGNNGGNNNTNEGVTFQPKQKEATIVTKGPTMAKNVNNPLDFEGCVKLMLMLPEGLPAGSTSMLQSKMLTMTSLNNVGALDGSPIFVIVPTLAETKHDITTTPPVKHKINYAFSVYVANLEAGDVYGTVEQGLMGVGDSDELALTNAIEAINPSDEKYQQMLNSAQERIISYYEANGNRLITEAGNLASVNNYEQALTILNNIPSACSCYDKAIAEKGEVMKKYFENNASVLIAKMKAALASPRDGEEGFSREFLALYAMVPSNSPSRKEADQLYAEYQTSLDKAAANIMARQQKEFEAAMRDKELIAKIESDRIAAEAAMYKEQMAAQVAIEGQTALLEKYKKDASYNKLGWLWKKLYIGKE